jgi:ArsR family transcriptional regulator
MVLHHLPSPSQVFHSARELMKPGGQLLIADLCSHDQDWTRHICGDLWLGFEPNDLDEWAQDADLVKGQSVYLGLRNGFQVQVRLYQQSPRLAAVTAAAVVEIDK